MVNDLNTLSSGFVAIAGVVVGFILTGVYNYYTEKGKEKRLKKNIRTLINLEIKQNLNLLKEFYKNVKNIKTVKNPTEKQLIDEYSRRLIELPLPPWRHTRWDSQTATLPLALSNDEISNIAFFIIN